MKTHIEHLPIDALVPYARNSRTHSAEQVAQVAASIREFGFTNPVLIDADGGIIAGHGRVMAARQLGLAEVPCIRLAHLSDAQKRAYIIADNKLALNAGWDEEMLALEFKDLNDLGFDLALTGFESDAIDELLAELGATPEGNTDADAVPEPQEVAITQPGDVWILGNHRLMCGDSRNPEDVALLMDGRRAALLHADPPYGMGKEADGVANDNLYDEKLDEFQMEWWRAFRPALDDTASAYIWGNAPDLWRLWYRRLGTSERLHFCNQIVWDKASSPEMTTESALQYPTTTEHCLFFKIGNQFVGNLNADEFPDAWQPLLDYLRGEADAAGMKPADVRRLCGVGMYSHWLSRSQFTLIPEKHYRTLAAEYPGRFTRPWADLRAEWERVRGAGRTLINSKLDGMRSYFDNTHDAMRDVWNFNRVTGEARHGHATPKPVAMIERVMKSSLPLGGLCAEPFGGSGSTLIAAESTGRACYTMELLPPWCDVAVRRWQQFTGRRALHAVSGEPFPEAAA